LVSDLLATHTRHVTTVLRVLFGILVRGDVPETTIRTRYMQRPTLDIFQIFVRRSLAQGEIAIFPIGILTWSVIEIENVRDTRNVIEIETVETGT
jgi:hypothetical protein